MTTQPENAEYLQVDQREDSCLNLKDPFEVIVWRMIVQHRSKLPEYTLKAVRVQSLINMSPAQYQIARILEKCVRANERLEDIESGTEREHSADWQGFTALMIDIAGHAILGAELQAEDEIGNVREVPAAPERGLEGSL